MVFGVVVLLLVVVLLEMERQYQKLESVERYRFLFFILLYNLYYFNGLYFKIKVEIFAVL